MSKQPKLSTFLRKAVKESESVYTVARGSGVTYANLMHFLSGDHELAQREIDSLVAFFGLRFVMPPAKEKALAERK
jgi:hypothetical protein